MAQTDFDVGLANYKATLMPMYRRKTALIAAREALRFQYLSGMKARIEKIFGDIYNAAMMDGDLANFQLLTAYLNEYKQNIPMTDMAGKSIDGYSYASSYWTSSRIGIFNPIQDIILKPFFDATNIDQRPMIEIYRIADISNMGVNWLIQNYRFWQAPVNTPVNDYISAKLSKTYASGTFDVVLAAAKAMWTKLVDDTIFIANIQADINEVEKQLSDFVVHNIDYAKGMNAIGFLTAIQAEADKSDVTPPTPPEPQAQLLAMVSPPPVMPTAPKSNIWMMLAAAAIAAVVVSGKKE